MRMRENLGKVILSRIRVIWIVKIPSNSIMEWDHTWPVATIILDYRTVWFSKESLPKENVTLAVVLRKGTIEPMISVIYRMTPSGLINISCMTPALDALIPIRHQGPINDYNRRIRDYVPPEHKRFLEYLDVSPNLRELIIEYKSDRIIEKFNGFIDVYAEQRSKHIQV